MSESRLDQQTTLLLDELAVGVEHGEYNSVHEALGVILEEFEEFKAEIFKNDTARAVEEARQVAATALRFCLEFDRREY